MALPSFLCIGAQKAGTSWLFAQLSRHPGIWMPPVKELHFFDHVFIEPNRKWTTSHIQHGVQGPLKWHLNNASPIDWSYVHYLTGMAASDLFSESWYRRCFDRPIAADKVCGDITPEYSCLPEEGIDYVKALLPGVRIIYIVRDPVGRAMSQLRMAIERRGITPDESTLLAMCDEWDIDNRGDYRTYIPRWRRHFEDRDLLILPYGDIKTDPAGFMKAVEKHLKITASDRYDLEARIHATRKIDIPPVVTEKLEQKFAPQRAFLLEEFGEDFTLRTR